MAVRRLTERLTAWRIGDPDGRFPIYSGEGSVRIEGRWHRKGQEIIYASDHYGTAMLEKLVHYNGILPPDQHFITIEIPAGISYGVVTKDSLPGWDELDGAVSRAFGAAWIDSARSAILIVPSVVAREESNILINPLHPDAKRIRASAEKPVRWHQRLFSA